MYAHCQEINSLIARVSWQISHTEAEFVCNRVFPPWLFSFQINHCFKARKFARPSAWLLAADHFLSFHLFYAVVRSSQICELSSLTNSDSEHFHQSTDRVGRKDLVGWMAHVPGALLTGECKAGVSLISSAYERLASICLSATSLSVCCITACQALSG